jgi:hypothetical protein
MALYRLSIPERSLRHLVRLDGFGPIEAASAQAAAETYAGRIARHLHGAAGYSDECIHNPREFGRFAYVPYIAPSKGAAVGRRVTIKVRPCREP